MNQGDLVHIPQGVDLWCETEKGMRMRRTERTLIILNEIALNGYL